MLNPLVGAMVPVLKGGVCVLQLDPEDTENPWEYSDLALAVGLMNPCVKLPHVEVIIPPDCYILILGHLLHGGSKCKLPQGGWRLHT
jgi:hypothetical protein